MRSKIRLSTGPIKRSLRKSPTARKLYKVIKLRAAPITTVVNSSFTYDDWINHCEPALWTTTKQKQNGPKISIIVPCYNTPPKYLHPLVESVLAQTYQDWQLVLADGSSKPESNKLIEKTASKDARITYKKVGKNLGIVGNTNEGLKLAEGIFVAFMDHDDTLSPYALAEVAIAINGDPKVDLIYSDEDKLSDDGKTRQLPFFKPDWSPELLLGVNYITHLVVARKWLVDKIGGLREGFDGAQDYDFLLRITEKTDRIKHIPKILYHWRLAEGSTAKDAGEKNYADTAGQQALADAAKRRGIKAEVVEIPERPTNYRLRFKLPAKQPKVSVIIPFKDKADLLKQCVGSILEKTTYKNYELILVSNNSTEQATHDYLKELKKDKRCKVHIWDHPFNYSKVNNFARTKATGDYLVLLNNDTEVITSEWLDELIGVASQPAVGAVGALLHYSNKTIQHAGVILGMTGMAGHVFRLRLPTDWTDFGMPAWPRNYLAVTAACLAVEAKKYDEMGGLDETFTVAGNDVAFGIKLHEAGYRNVYWPFAELIHYENVSVGSYQNVPQLDYDHSLEYYRPYLDNGDPYFNPNLDLMNEQVGLKETA
ncbi:MAG TPA: glycosyltransferase [Candidatus Saccharimonadales bacterium]|nr:glycosyltransferase [Candidatus Saccharimonadales bacterium]